MNGLSGTISSVLVADRDCPPSSFGRGTIVGLMCCAPVRYEEYRDAARDI